MVSKRSDERPTGNPPPASRPCTMGQRPYALVVQFPVNSRGWFLFGTNPKDDEGKPEVPSVWSGFRNERIGSGISHHLHTSVEYVTVNVGGPCGEGSSPPVKRMGVGAAIVLGARESRVHGEGWQGIDVRLTNNQGSFGEVRMVLGYPSRPDERETNDRRRREVTIPGEPDAVKVARPVRKGGWGNTVWLCALPLPYSASGRWCCSAAPRASANPP